MKKLILVFLALFLFSCNNDDFIEVVDYNKNITLNNSSIRHHSFDVLEFKSNVTNTSDKNIIIDITFDIYYIDMYFGPISLNDFEVNKNSTTLINKTFYFRYFDYQHFNIRNIKFSIKKAY